MYDYLTLGDLQDKYNAMTCPDSQLLKYGVSTPMSWRGSYDEVAFVVEADISLGDCKKYIQQALTDKFYGYKGGEYHYNRNTPVNFEESSSSWSDGYYAEFMFDRINDVEEPSINHKLAEVLTNGAQSYS